MVVAIERPTFAPGCEVRFLKGDRKGKIGTVTGDCPSDPLDYGSVPVKVVGLQKVLWVKPTWLEIANPFKEGEVYYHGEIKVRVEKIFSSVKKAEVVADGETESYRVSFSQLSDEPIKNSDDLLAQSSELQNNNQFQECHTQSSPSSPASPNSVAVESPKQDCQTDSLSPNLLSATNTDSASLDNIIPAPLFSTTLPLTEGSVINSSLSSEEAPARTIPAPILSAQDLQAIALAYGGSNCELSRNADPQSCSGKTQQDVDTQSNPEGCLPLEWFSGRLAVAGTFVSGNQSEPVTWERPTKETGFSLLPTPMTCSSDATEYRRPGQDKLEQALKPLLPEGHVSHPNVREWAMGVPLDWTAIQEEETGSALPEQRAPFPEASAIEEKELQPLATAAPLSNPQFVGNISTTSVISSNFEEKCVQVEDHPSFLRIELTEIRRDGGTQPRAAINLNHVRLLEQQIDDGQAVEPVTVFYDGADYWLADGFHRWQAHHNLEKLDIACTIVQGTRRDAVLYSCGANSDHKPALARSNDDKRRAVLMLLNDLEWGQWSDKEIAKTCKVSAPFVAKIKNLTVNVYSNKTLQSSAKEAGYLDSKTYKTKHGTVAKMKTGNIGKAKAVTDSESSANTEPNESKSSSYETFAPIAESSFDQVCTPFMSRMAEARKDHVIAIAERASDEWNAATITAFCKTAIRNMTEEEKYLLIEEIASK